MLSLIVNWTPKMCTELLKFLDVKMTMGKTLFLFVLQISMPENECPF